MSCIFAVISALSIYALAGVDKKNNNLITLTDDNFGKEIKNDIVIVDFWAVWCGPCQRQGPIIEDLAIELKKRARVGKLDIDKNQMVADLYQVTNIPTIIIFKKGKPAKRFVGLTTREEIIQAIELIEKQ